MDAEIFGDMLEEYLDALREEGAEPVSRPAATPCDDTDDFAPEE